MVDNQVVKDFDVAAYLGIVGMRVRADCRVDVLVNNAVFQREIYAGIVVALPRPSCHLCAVDRRNRAVAIVSKTAGQDAQANTSINDYADIAVRIMEVESSWSYPLNRMGRSEFAT